METPHISELIRRLENLVRAGTIARVDVKRARVRVQCGGLLCDWLPWISLRAGTVRHWSPPSPGEQCLLLAPGGDLANAVVLVGYFSDHIHANDNRDHIHATRQPDGTLEQYDHQAHQALLQCVGDIVREAQGSIRDEALGAIHQKAAGPIVLESGESITLRVGGASIVLTDSGATVDPDIVGGGRISLVSHVHERVRQGWDDSGGPK